MSGRSLFRDTKDVIDGRFDGRTTNGMNAHKVDLLDVKMRRKSELNGSKVPDKGIVDKTVSNDELHRINGVCKEKRLSNGLKVDLTVESFVRVKDWKNRFESKIIVKDTNESLFNREGLCGGHRSRNTLDKE